MNRFLIILALFALSACAALQDKKHAGPVHILYSPTGDPLNGGPLGKPNCPDAIKRWFIRVNANHDGIVTLDEFLNDARIQFQRMDIDKNGYLVSEEVERFRMAYRDEPAGEKPAASAPASTIDPVMSADANLDYKVTPDEFMAYSRKEFRRLDADHNGTLSVAEATAAICGAKP